MCRPGLLIFIRSVVLASGLRSIMLNDWFNPNLRNVMLASGLRSIMFCYWFNTNLGNVMLASGPHSITFSCLSDCQPSWAAGHLVSPNIPGSLTLAFAILRIALTN